MRLRIKSVKIIDPNSPFYRKTKDLLVENNTITRIADKIRGRKGERVYDAKGQMISPGWFDMQASLGDPGFEHKEDLDSGSKAAAKGGFTGLLLMPDTNPSIQSKSQVEYIKKKTQGGAVDIIPAGAITQNREGEELTEMYDMYKAGAAAFSDGDHPSSDSGMLMRALLYVKPFNGLILSKPEDISLSNGGLMHEGVISTKLGLQGMPSMAEENMVARDIKLAEYTDSRLHISSVSAAGTIDLIRQAKKNGIHITASVASYQLAFDESVMIDYDTSFKVNPPLRSLADIKALKKGLADGTIDVISSNHTPQDEESKRVEFDIAAFGMINLETSFAVANTYLKDTLKIEQLIDKIAIQPRRILHFDVPVIKEKAIANFTIFDPSETWVVEEAEILSKSKNSPFLGQSLKGRAKAIFNNKQFIVN